MWLLFLQKALSGESLFAEESSIACHLVTILENSAKSSLTSLIKDITGKLRCVLLSKGFVINGSIQVLEPFNEGNIIWIGRFLDKYLQSVLVRYNVCLRRFEGNVSCFFWKR